MPSASSAPKSSTRASRTAAQTSWASSAVAVMPVPMARWLVSDDELRGVGDLETGKTGLHLSDDVLDVGAGLADLQRLAAAEDGNDAAGDERLGLLVLVLIGLVEVVATLGVTDDAVGAASGLEHRDGGLTGVGAGSLPVAVLGAKRDGGTLELVSYAAQVDRGRAHENLDARGDLGQGLDELGGESLAASRSLFIFQLPAIRVVRLFGIVERLHSRKGLTLDELHGSATAGGDPAHLVGQVELVDSRDGVATTDDGGAVGLGDGLGDRWVPWAKLSNSKTPMGPFQNTVLAPLMASA